MPAEIGFFASDRIMQAMNAEPISRRCPYGIGVVRMRLPFVLLTFLMSCEPPPGPVQDANPMKLLWEIPYDFIGIAVDTDPLIVGDSLVVMSAGKELWAVEQTTGAVRWKTFVSNETNLQSKVMRTDGVRIFATHVEDVRAYRLDSGELLWITSLPADRGQFWGDEIAYVDGRLLVGGLHTAYCLDAITGSILWQRQLQTSGQVTDAAATSNRAYFGGAWGISDFETITNVYCLDLTTGDSVWTQRLSGNGRTYLYSSVVDNTLYAGTTFETPSSFEAIDATTGVVKWKYTTSAFWNYNGALVVGDKVIANAGLYHVCAFDNVSGQLLWRTFIVEDANAGKLHLADGFIYHPHGIRIRILDPNSGRLAYTLYGSHDNWLYTMAVGNGRVFVHGSRYLQCYKTFRQGSVIWLRPD